MLDEEPTLLNKEAKPFKFIEKELNYTGILIEPNTFNFSKFLNFSS